AGRRRFGWVFDTDVLAERSAEVEWWAWEHPRDVRANTVLSVNGVVGITDNIEAALPIELWMGPNQALIAVYGLDLRFRLAPADPVKAGPVVPLIRLGVKRLAQPDGVRGEGNLVLSVDMGPRVHAALDIGGFVESAPERVYLSGGLGLSVKATDDLNIGA